MHKTRPSLTAPDDGATSAAPRWDILSGTGVVPISKQRRSEPPAETTDPALVRFQEWLDAAREYHRAVRACGEFVKDVDVPAELQAAEDAAEQRMRAIEDTLVDVNATTVAGAMAKLHIAVYYMLDCDDPADVDSWRSFYLDQPYADEKMIARDALRDLQRLMATEIDR